MRRRTEKNIMLEAVLAFFVYIVESFTGSVLENYGTVSTCGRVNNANNSEVESLVLGKRPGRLYRICRSDKLKRHSFSRIWRPSRKLWQYGVEALPTCAVEILSDVFQGRVCDAVRVWIWYSFTRHRSCSFGFQHGRSLLRKDVQLELYAANNPEH